MKKLLIAILLGLFLVLMGQINEPNVIAQAKPEKRPETKSDAQINFTELNNFYREFNPQQFQKVKRLQEELQRYWNEMQELKKLKEDKPEEFERLKEEKPKQFDKQKGPGEKPPFPREPREGFEKDKLPPQPPDDVEPENIDPNEVIKFAKEFMPELAEDLAKMKEENPERYRNVIRENYIKMQHLREMKKRNPEQFERVIQEQKMEREARNLAEKYRQSKDDKEKEAVKKELRKLLEKIFDLKELDKQEEVKRVEEQLNKLKEKVNKRKSERDKIIDDRLKQLTGEKEEWGW